MTVVAPATRGGTLLPMQLLADEYHLHVRTLRKAARDGRLEATFSTRTAFGHASCSNGLISRRHQPERRVFSCC